MKIEAKLEALELTLPEQFTPPAGTKLHFEIEAEVEISE